MKQRIKTTVPDFYYSLDKKQRTIFRKNVQNLSGLNYYSFFYRLKNNSWSKLEFTAMNDMLEGTKYLLVKNLKEAESQIIPMNIE